MLKNMKVFVRYNITSICISAQVKHIIPPSTTPYQTVSFEEFEFQQQLFQELATTHKTAKLHVTCYINYVLLAAFQSVHPTWIFYF